MDESSPMIAMTTKSSISVNPFVGSLRIQIDEDDCDDDDDKDANEDLLRPCIVLGKSSRDYEVSKPRALWPQGGPASILRFLKLDVCHGYSLPYSPKNTLIPYPHPCKTSYVLHGLGEGSRDFCETGKEGLAR